LARVGVEASLEEESLLRAARRVTRLTDFGDDDFREPLRRVLRSYAGEAALSPTGRALKRVDWIDMLATRLRVRREVSDRPELAEGTPRRPLVVTGLPRTGTTLLQRLLSLDATARPLLAWEAMWPAPLSRGRDDGPDRRIRYTRRLVWLSRRVLPGIDRIHPLDPDGPEECTRLLDSSFRWGYLAIERSMPEYAAWLGSLGPAGMEVAYRWYALQLRVLEGQRPTPGHWVLKSPAHLGLLGSLFAVMPDARVVVTVRDPRATVASACSLFALLHGTTAADARTGGIGPGIAATLARTLARGLEVAASDPARVRVVRYDDLVARPIETLEAVHAGLGLPFTPELAGAARDWLARNPQRAHGVHRYDLATYGLDEARVLELFAGTEESLGRIRS
jgi:hypothetical protein